MLSTSARLNLLFKLKLITDEVKTELVLGDANVLDIVDRTDPQPIFNFMVELWTEVVSGISRSRSASFYEYSDLCFLMIDSILLQSFQTGVCRTQTAAVMTKIVERELDVKVECVALYGEKQYKYLQKTQEKDQVCSETNHVLVVVNRNPQSMPELPSTWDAVIVDTWLDGQYLDYKNPYQIPRVNFNGEKVMVGVHPLIERKCDAKKLFTHMVDCKDGFSSEGIMMYLTRGFFQLSKVKVLLGINKPLKKKNWKQIAIILGDAKKIMQQKIDVLGKKHGRHEKTRKDDLEKVTKAFELKISYYQMKACKFDFLIRHYSVAAPANNMAETSEDSVSVAHQFKAR